MRSLFFIQILLTSLIISCSGMMSDAFENSKNGDVIYSIKGTISFQENGVEGVTVTLTKDDFSTSTVTDAQGAFLFSRLNKGEYAISGEMDGYYINSVKETYTIENASLSGVKLYAFTAYVVSGKVQNDGTGVSGCSVEISNTLFTERVATDGSGNFTFSKVPNGIYTVRPIESTYSFAPSTQEVVVNDSSVSDVSFISGFTLWENSFGTDYSNGLKKVIQSSDNSFLAVGYNSSPEKYKDFYIVKFTATGAILWEKTYGGVFDDIAKAITETSDGYIITGETASFGAGGLDIWIFKVDKNGEYQWDKTYGGVGSETANAISLNGDGFIIAGHNYREGYTDKQGIVINFDQQGNVLWEKSYGSIRDDEILNIKQLADGNFLLTGYSDFYYESGKDIYTMKIGASGDVLWSSLNGREGADTATGIHELANGNILIVGHSKGVLYSEMYVVTLDAQGTTISEKSYSTDNTLDVRGVSTDAGGNIFVFGIKYTDVAVYQGFISNISADGELLWQKYYGNSSENNLNGLVCLNDGMIISGSQNISETNDNFWLQSLNSAGDATE